MYEQFFSSEGSQVVDGLPLTSEFTSPAGTTQTLADYTGEPLVLNFFASWCPPCRAELPEFQEVSDEVAGEVQFLGVNTDFQKDAWLSLIDEVGVTFPTVFQPSNELFAAAGGIGMPTTVFIAPDGSTAFSFTGPLTGDRLRELIAEHLTS